jgi:predicted branched-subunit amino acid permease
MTQTTLPATAPGPWALDVDASGGRSAARPSPGVAARADVAAMAAAVVPFGVVVGIATAAAGVPLATGLLGGAAVYGGSAQLTATTTLATGGTIGAAVVSGLVVSGRLVLYSAALAPFFRDQPRWFRWLTVQFVVDQTYLAAIGRAGGSAAWFRRYWLALGTLLLAVWVLALGAGTLVGPMLPPLPHLGLVGTALFACLLVPRLVSRPAVAAAGAGASVAVLATWLAPGQGVLLGAAAGVAAGLAAERRWAR